jgi:hypothetical protein
MLPNDSSNPTASNPDHESAADKLVHSVRALVREELQLPSKLPSTEQLPTWGDAVWLLIFICNVALVFSIVPLLNSQIEFLYKLVPWLFGGLFVVANAWFRDRLLEISRLRMFRASQALFLFFAIILPHARIIPFRVTVQPQNASLSIDKISVDHGRVIWLSPWNHAVTISRDKNDVPADSREFELGWWELIPAALSKDMKPIWGLIYPLDVDTSEATSGKCTILITKHWPFGRDFLEPQSLRSHNMIRVSDKIVEYTSESTTRTFLPFGKYNMQIGMDGCEPEVVDVENKISNYHRFSACPKGMKQ